MGMSSSQARLLTLTARMHDIEYKAQRIEAQKLQMANESRRVYEDYLNALDARKIQFKTMNNDGSITFIDANLNRLENGAVSGWEDDLTSNKTFLLINHDTNELYLTPAFAAEYGFDDGQELGYDGTLDDYLTENEAIKDTYDIYGPDYDKPIAWTPVTNGRVEPYHAGNEGTTVYGISGNISSETTTSPGQYTLNESLSDLVISFSDPTIGTTQEMSYMPVSGGFNVSSPTTTSSIILPSTYKPINTTSFIFDSNGTLWGELINNCGIPRNDTAYIAAYYNGEQQYAIQYTPEKENSYIYNDLLEFRAHSNLDVIGGIATESTSFTGYNGYWSLAICNEDGSINEEATNQLYSYYIENIEYTEGSQTNITKTTTLKELMYSDEGISGGRANMPLLTIDGTTYDFSELNGINGIDDESDFENLTLGQYVTAINNKTAGLNLTFNETNGSFDIDGNHTISFNYIGATSNTTTQTQVNINLDALAKNIDLAYQISAGLADNVSSLGNIDTLKSILREKSGQNLARMFNDLTAAFESNNTAEIKTIYEKIYDYIIHDNGSNAYPTSGEKFNDSSYIFNITDNDIGSASYTPAQGGTNNNGSISFNNNYEDIKILLAEAVLNDKSQSPIDFYNSDDNILQTLTMIEICMFMTYYNTSEWDNALSALRTAISEKNKDKLGKYINESSTGYAKNKYYIGYGGLHNIQEIPPTDHVTTTSSADDILDKLAYDIYSAHSSEYSDPNQVKSALSSLYNDSDGKLASISTFANDSSSWSNIISQLYNQIKGGEAIDSNYTNKFDGYEVTYATGNNVNFTSEVVGATDPVMGTVHMADVEAIKSNLEYALKHANSSKTAEQIVTGKSDAQLYMINEIVCEYLSSGGENSSRFTAMIGGDIPASPYSTSEYNYSKDISGTCKPTKYDEKVVGQKEVWRKDETYNRLVNEYNLQQKFKGLKVKIIEEPLASSVDFVSNFLTFDNAYIVEFDKVKQEIYDTSVATNTNLQEVSDEKDLKKAEAKYEADMKRIDMKDRRYDTELAALDNERNAVKLEMETVKTVAKDNVDRTFRLFS